MVRAVGQFRGSMARRIFPRIRDCLPTGTILEIARGLADGRLPQRLLRTALIVDRVEECIEACRQRFSPAIRVKLLRQRRSLAIDVSDESIDFVFSLDSLVHPRGGSSKRTSTAW